MSNEKLARMLLFIYVLELLAVHFVNGYFYYTVINTWMYNIAILPQILCYVVILDVGKGKMFIANIVLLVLIPLVFILALPSTTYEGGKAIVANEIDSNEATFIPTSYSLIQTTDKQSWFIRDYSYHYEVKVSGEVQYYVVDPMTAGVIQLEEDFFRYDR